MGRLDEENVERPLRYSILKRMLIIQAPLYPRGGELFPFVLSDHHFIEQGQEYGQISYVQRKPIVSVTSIKNQAIAIIINFKNQALKVFFFFFNSYQLRSISDLLLLGM